MKRSKTFSVAVFFEPGYSARVGVEKKVQADVDSLLCIDGSDAR